MTKLFDHLTDASSETTGVEHSWRIPL